MKYEPKSNKKVALRFEYAGEIWSQWACMSPELEMWLNLLELKFWSSKDGAWEVTITVLGFSFAGGRYVR